MTSSTEEILRALVQRDGWDRVSLELGRLEPDRPVAAHGSRTGDPETSTAAARRHQTDDVGRFSDRSRKAELLMLFALGDSWTPREAATRLGYAEGTRRRISDLKAARFIRGTGFKRSNPPPEAGEAETYVITELGLRAARRLKRTGWSR